MTRRRRVATSLEARDLSRTRRSRRGFTIVENLLALMIFSVGLIVIAGTAVLIVKTVTATQSRVVAAAVAESRFDRIHATPCASRASGSATTRGIPEAWTLNRLTRADDVTVTVTISSYHQRRTETFQSFLPC